MKEMMILKEKLSTKNLRRLCEENATKDRVLVIHSEDVPYESYFPNAYTVTKNENVKADLHVDLYYKSLDKINGEEYNFILCTGLLEHIPDPQRIIDDFYRILKPEGKLVIAASAVSSFHEGPNDFFRFTPYGFKLLFSQWKNINIKGSSLPFETIAILLQRILLQSKVKHRIIRLSIELLCLFLPNLDRYVVKQYSTRNPKNQETEIDSMLPYEIFAVAIK